MTAIVLAALAAAYPTAALLLHLSAQENHTGATIRITTSASVSPLHRYWAGSPNMLVLDLRGTTLAMPQGTAYSGGAVRVRIGQFTKTTARVVVESTTPFSYSVTTRGNDVTVQVRFPERPASVPSSAEPEGLKLPMEPRPSGPPKPVTQFSIVALGTLHSVALTIAAISGTTIRVHPSVAARPAALNLPRTTLQQALAELSRQTGTRWRTAADGAIEITE